MTFDLAQFVIRRGIDHVTRGPNVARGHINIKCPFCGDDPSHHLGIQVKGGAWGCWRDRRHRGKDPRRLVQALLRCSLDEADRIVVDGSDLLAVGVDGLTEQLKALDAEPRRVVSKRVVWPDGVYPVDEQPNAKRARVYLEERGFLAGDVLAVANHYGLRVGVSGEWRGRLLVPVVDRGRLIGWTGRAMGKAEIKYRAHPGGDTIKRYLLNADAARLPGAEVLVVVEGPLDTIKLDWYGRGCGVVVVGLMGASWTPTQTAALVALGGSFRRVVVLLDPDADVQALDLQSRLRSVRAVVHRLDVAPDPGALTPGQARRLAHQLSA